MGQSWILEETGEKKSQSVSELVNVKESYIECDGMTTTIYHIRGCQCTQKNYNIESKAVVSKDTVALFYIMENLVL